MPKMEHYDVSPEMARAIKEKAAQRAVRREQYIKFMSDPYRWATETVPVDMGLERYEAQRTFTGQYRFFRPTFKSFVWHFMGVWFPVITFTVWAENYRGKREKAFRTGQVAYKDRDERFA